MSQLSTGLADHERKRHGGAAKSGDDRLPSESKPDPLAGYYTEKELSALLKKGRRTLRNWRKAGEGPPFAVLGVTVIYPIAGVDKWLTKRVQTPVRGK
jgi:hypothetical protein